MGQEILEAALAYAKLGWYVFPLNPRSKAPATSNGHHGASKDEAQIRAWFSDGDFNIGVAVKPSGLVVLDVDVSDGKGGAKSLEDIASNLTDTTVASTGSGGAHLIFQRTSDAQARRKIRFLDGLDLLGDGYFITAPSVHPNGGIYRWIRMAPIAPLPAFLASFYTDPSPETLENSPRLDLGEGSGYPPASENVLQSARQRLLRHGPAVSGKGGDQHTFEVGAILFRDYGLSAEEAWPLALEWNRTCQPSWSEIELAEKLRNGATYGEAPIGRERDLVESKPAFLEWVAKATPQEPAPEPGSWKAMLLEAHRDIQALLTASSGEEVTPLFEPAHTMLERPRKETVWLVQWMLTSGVGLLGGEPKTSKTWAALEIAIAIATGTPAFGAYAAKPARAAYFFAEDGEQSIGNRVRSLCAGMSGRENLSRLFVQPRGRFIDITRDEDLALLVASCRMIGDLELVVLDPLRDIHSAEEDSSDAMKTVMQRLRAVSVLLGASVMAVHHTAKSSADTAQRRPGQRLRGSSAIHGAIDFGIYLSDLTGDGETTFGNHVTSEVKAARGAGHVDVLLSITDNEQGEAIKATWSMEKLSAEEKSEKSDAEADEKILALIRKLGPIGWTQVRDMVTGMRKTSADAAKARLLAPPARIEEWSEHSLDALGRMRKKVLVRALDTPAAPQNAND